MLGRGKRCSTVGPPYVGQKESPTNGETVYKRRYAADKLCKVSVTVKGGEASQHGRDDACKVRAGKGSRSGVWVSIRG